METRLVVDTFADAENKPKSKRTAPKQKIEGVWVSGRTISPLSVLPPIDSGCAPVELGWEARWVLEFVTSRRLSPASGVQKGADDGVFGISFFWGLIGQASLGKGKGQLFVDFDFDRMSVVLRYTRWVLSNSVGLGEGLKGLVWTFYRVQAGRNSDELQGGSAQGTECGTALNGRIFRLRRRFFSSIAIDRSMGHYLHTSTPCSDRDALLARLFNVQDTLWIASLCSAPISLDWFRFFQSVSLSLVVS
ncbi:hypothetical protein GYMLUDRAFT_248383 [Collybiopsis luxurians FD-317 M1]|uniref:Uncharacterized protein n=1 Tax=Collybiopsis luxurians FD-317 M1 TaxID=944289 RepID=A0A0D0BLV3_9AGAR|nr:hypothetical protein GYMLUDRAFT_248383 [Collybiopsis luxurians FD-317 M1]